MAGLTSKVDINLGYGCNCKCPFCYYYDSVITNANLNTLTTEQAKQQLRRARRLGIKEIEFTGGEVTLRKDLVELVQFCKFELGFKLVSIITNGMALAKREYTNRLVAAGVDDVLFSLHGHNSEIHDQLTVTPGSFEKIIRAMEICSEMGVRVRTNTVVCKPNLAHLSDLLELCINKNVDNISLVMFNPIIQRTNVSSQEGLYVNYAEAGREMVKAFDKHKARLPHTNVRYIPFCFLPGYESFVTNHDQFNFEPDEWNNFVSVCIQDGVLRATVRALRGLRDVRYKRFAMKYGVRGLLMAGMGRFYTLYQKVKPKQCSQCAYNHVCDYLWKGYHDVYGDEDVVPVKGESVNNPIWVTNAANIRKPGSLPDKYQDSNILRFRSI